MISSIGLLAFWSIGGEVFITELPNGTIEISDSPLTSGTSIFQLDGPPPTLKHVNDKNFPNLDLWDFYILDSATRYALPAALVKAIILAESAMIPTAESNVGAMGLMQLMPGTAKALEVKDPWDPQQNIDGGCRYIREQIDNLGNYRLAIAAYHAGPGNVRKYNGIPPFESTQTYVTRVMEYFEHFKNQYPIIP
ncbi:MAG: lytic transglycosylase domain-containing protein [Myxococcota bacterium]|nr:lytic transglycosylase domain-containing protein [Myxococcota bacterium]